MEWAEPAVAEPTGEAETLLDLLTGKEEDVVASDAEDSRLRAKVVQ